MQCLALSLVLLLASALALPSRVEPSRRASGRIIGGTDADIADYPWQASLQLLGEHYCGGSIISDSWVLTAAHCVDGYVMANVSVRVGSSFHESGGSVLPATTGIIHESYDADHHDYDMAVVQVSGSLLGSNSQAVDLPSDDYDPEDGLAVTVTGWGVTTPNGEFSPTLLKVDTSIRDRSFCQRYVVSTVTERMVCAGRPGSSVCYGDSGGALVSSGTQVGIVSFGSRRCDEAPALFSNVGNMRSWIRQTTGV